MSEAILTVQLSDWVTARAKEIDRPARPRDMMMMMMMMMMMEMMEMMIEMMIGVGDASSYTISCYLQRLVSAARY